MWGCLEGSSSLQGCPHISLCARPPPCPAVCLHAYCTARVLSDRIAAPCLQFTLRYADMDHVPAISEAVTGRRWQSAMYVFVKHTCTGRTWWQSMAKCSKGAGYFERVVHRIPSVLLPSLALSLHAEYLRAHPSVDAAINARCVLVAFTSTGPQLAIKVGGQMWVCICKKQSVHYY